MRMSYREAQAVSSNALYLADNVRILCLYCNSMFYHITFLRINELDINIYYTPVICLIAGWLQNKNSYFIIVDLYSQM